MRRLVRRLTRFGLSSLLILVTLCAAFLAWRTNRSRVYRAAVRELQTSETNGLIYVEFREPPKWSPSWARPLLGHDRASLVRRVMIQDAPTEEDLRALAKLTQLEVLNFQYERTVTDDTLKYVRGLTNLELLSFWDVPVTGSGFPHLRDLKRLKKLYLIEIPLEDEHLKHLEPLDQLEDLWVLCNSLSDASVPHLAKLRSLKKLKFGQLTKVTPDGYQKLQEALPNCKIDWQPATSAGAPSP